MTITAKSADGILHKFPDDTDTAVIDRVMKQYAQSIQTRVQPEEKPEEKPEETPSIGSQLYGAIPEIAKGFTRGVTVDPISGASSLAYNAARAADPSMARFEDTGFGKKLAKAQEYLAPNDSGMITQIASGVGSLASLVPGGLLKGGLKAITLAAQAGGWGSEEARARADQATIEGKPVSAQQQLASQAMAVPAGLLELLPVERLARPIKAIFSKVKLEDIEEYAPSIFNKVKRIAGTGSIEAVQEATSNIIQDLIQKGVYDPTLEVGQSALANAEIGGAVGALAQTAVELVTRGKMKQKYTELKQEEGEKKIAEQVQAIKDKQDAKDKETRERLGIDPNQLYLPAPPKQIEEDKTETDAVMNPLGLISHGELTPELVKQINDQRKADGKEKLKNFSIEDLVDAQVPQQNIDSILTSKANFTGETKLTGQDVLNVASERNIDTRVDGFSDFLARTTGSRDLKGMTQPQLHAAFKSLSSMEKNESLTMLPTGTNAKRFTQEQYNKSVDSIKKLVFKDTGRLGRSSIIKEIKDYSKLENDSDAESLLNTAVKNGEFSLVKKPIYHVVNNDGSILRSYTTRDSASKAALRDNLSVKDELTVDVVRPDSVSDIDEVSAGFGFLKMLKQDIGLDIRQGQFKQGVAPAAFEITRSDGVIIGTPHASMEAAEKASNTIREYRLAESKNFSAAADRALKSIDANNNSLLKMQSVGTVSEIDLLKASANIAKNNRQLEVNEKKLRAQAELYAQPLTIAPKGEKVISKKGFTYFENDAPVATFDSREQAEKSLLARRTDAELATIVEKATKKGGATANRIIGSVQQEMSNRAGTEPKGFRVRYKGNKKNAEARLSGVGGAGVFTPELRVAAEKLSNKLRPILDRLGLKDLRLNMVTSITTPSGDQADGEYSKALIKISLLAEDPMRTLNHEAIHALKELGAFTKDQWRVLSNKAKSEWIETYNIKARYSGLDAEGQIEEAIADAFSDFAIKPQPGMMGAIVAKIKSFFEALKNSMNDLGFQTYQDVFADVATGNLSSYSGKATTLGDTVRYQARGYSDDKLAKDDLSQQPNSWKATAEDLNKAEEYFSENGVKPYTSEGQLTLPLSFDGKKYSIKQAYSEEKREKAAKTTDRSGKPRVAKQLKNDPYTGLPLNQNGTVTLYFPTTNEAARELRQSKVLRGHSPTANKIYLTNESSAAAVEDKVGLIDQPVGGANVLIQIDPALLHVLEQYDDGRKDFFIPIAEGKAFEKKIRQVKLFTLKASRDKGLHPDRTLSEVTKSVNDTVTAWANASAAERKVMQKVARDTLRDEHNIGNLFGANAKLEKTNIGDHGLTFNGKKVMSTGLGFSAAQKINDTQRNATTCPMSANCRALCLAETSGGNRLYGGEGVWRSGPRLSQYLRTEALIVNPEAFAVSMVKQIELFRNAAKRLGYHPAIRLNVTSDFHPKTFENIINLFPDVTFYDYTKLRGSKSIAPNHYLTYSSTGASQIVNNEVIYNAHSNWDKMVDSVLGRGLNVAMAFSSKTEMPKFVLDERTGTKFDVWNGDEYDARFLDPVGKDGKGLVIGLGNKDDTTSAEEAAKKHKGFFIDYKKRDGDTLVIPNQSKIKEPAAQDSDTKYSIKAPASDIGFYSPIEKAALNLSRSKGTGLSFLNDLKKGDSVTRDELTYTGIEDWLKSKQNLTKQEVQDYIANNKVDVQESVLDDRSSEFQTKHYKWQLPNGDKYTEILLILPLPKKILDELDAALRNVKTLQNQYEDVSRKIRSYDPDIVEARNNLKLLESPLDLLLKEIYPQTNAKTIEELTQEYTKLVDLHNKASIKVEELTRKIDENTYETNHWDEPNVLAHIRISHRIDANGKKTTLIEEIQSDWHQAGRKNGYRGDEQKIPFDDPDYVQARQRARELWEKFTGNASRPDRQAEIAPMIREAERVVDSFADHNNKIRNSAPDAPFKEDWYKLALKRAIKEAVDNGSESISLTTGKRQIERYSNELRKTVDEINFQVSDEIYNGREILITANKSDSYGSERQIFKGLVRDGKFLAGKYKDKTIAEVFGKSIATKIQNHDPSQGVGVIKGDDLSIGGEGMKKYYDEIYPAFLNSFGKKYDVKVEDNAIPIKNIAFTDEPRNSQEKVRTLPITPKMSEDVRKGQRMFSITRRINVDGVSRSTVNNKGQAIAATDEKLTNFWRWFGDSKVVDDEGSPMVVYRGVDKDYDGEVRIAKDGALGSGIYTTPLAEFASEYAKVNGGNIMPLYVSLKNPLILREGSEDPMVLALVQLGMSKNKAETLVEKAYEEKGYVGKQVMNRAQSQNYDGIMQYRNGKLTEIVAFNRLQLKSSTGNIGAFSKANESTKYSIRDRIPTNIQADINRTTHVRDEAGYPKRIMAAVTPDGFQKHLLRFRQSYINRYESIERLSKRVAERFGIDELLAHTSAAASALFSDRAAGVTASVLKNGVPVYRDGMTTVSDFDGSVKGLIPVFEPLAQRNDPYIYQVFQYYAGIKRGGRLQAEGKEKLFTDKDGAAYAAALEREFPEFVDVLKEYQKFNNGLVQYMKDTGVISAKDADLWTKNWDYIPFYRQMEGESTSGPQIFQSISGVSKPKELKGGTAKLDDFLETVVRNTRAAVEAGMKNVAAQRVIRDVVRMDEGEKVRFNHPDASDIVSIKVNGVTEKYRVRDPLLVESLKSLDMPEIPGLALFSKPADLLRNLVTKDPGFILANLMRDSLSSYITSGTDMKPFIDTFKQFGNSLADSSPEVLALKKSGFFTGYEFSGDTQSSSEATLKELRKRTGTRTTAEKTFLPLTAMWGMLEKGSNASDLATRAEIYKRTLAETGNEAEALFRALEVMNFGRKGSSAGIRVLSAIIPFFNARIQGLDVLYRSGFGQGVMANREQAQKSFMIRAMTMFALSSMYWFMASDDEEYEKASQETKDNNWIIEGFKIPIPFELGVIFKVIPERLLAYYFGNDTGKDLREAMFRNLTSTMQVNLPQAILPVVETMANYSFFTGEPIVGMGTAGLEEKYQYTASTSTLAKKIGEKAADFRGAFGLPILPESPQLIDNLIKGYTGTLGTYAVMAIDSILTNEGDPVKATLKFEQLPVFKRFLASKDATGTVSSYYDLKEEVEKAVQTMNMLERTGNYEGMKEYFKGEKGNLIAIRPYINALDKNISELRDLKRMIQSSRMSGDRKRDTLTSITRAENSITARIQDIKKFVYK